MLMTIDLADLDYGVSDSELRQPDGVAVKIKVLTFTDRKSGITLQIPLPTEPPPGMKMPADFKPPAQEVAEKLMDNRPRVEVARSMPRSQGHNGH